MKYLYLSIVLAPLFGAAGAGLFCRLISRSLAHWLTILGVGVSFALSLYAMVDLVFLDGQPFNEALFTWMAVEGVEFQIGFLVDRLTVLMMTVVTFVSLMVHIYTIGYMHDDPGYQRFFSYIALFTFSMLMLVMSNNFLQLFFGWEAVGVVSYLLIGFWFTRESAIFANLKAFLVNRVGDFGFLLAIAAIYMYTGTLDYKEVFELVPGLADRTIQIFAGVDWSLMTVICILLFIGAMGKSAQVPLHVWLPDSMEGPTPISALIHAATMVTAGIFMVARMSPLYELSTTALSVVLVIGAITALFMGLLGLVQNDIKRVVAYSTLSQLGYMTVALGASAYAAGIFHLMTHAFFKALLFLGAGSVIIALHHEQDMRRMGRLKKYMPITYWTALIGSLALIGFPGFSGFFSKDAIIEAVHASHIPGAGFAYAAVLIGVFITALYSFRMFFLVFHSNDRMDEHTREHAKESPAVVTIPLILLAIPSLAIGWFTLEPMLFGDFFQGAIYVHPDRDVLAHVGEHYTGIWGFISHGIMAWPFWLAMAGVGTAFFIYQIRPKTADQIKNLHVSTQAIYKIFERKYGFDDFNQTFIAGGSRMLGNLFSWLGDRLIIDGLIVNGSAKAVAWLASVARNIQTGYLYHYAFAIILGVLGLISWRVMGMLGGS